MMLSSWPVFSSGIRTFGKARTTSPVLVGSGSRWRRWAIAIGIVPFAHPPGGGLDHAVGRAPAEDEQLGALVGVDLELGQFLGQLLELLRPQFGHQRVVGGVVADVAAAVAPSRGRRSGAGGPACRGSPRGGRRARRAGRAGTRRRRSAPRRSRGRSPAGRRVSGIRHGSEELARKVSASRITGVR